MDSAVEYWTARTLLEWQVEMGADEAMGETPIDRYALDPAPVKPAAVKAAPVKPPTQSNKADVAPRPTLPAAVEVDKVAAAQALAADCVDLDSLAATMASFEHCELKRGARNFCFADGNPASRVMVIGEAPGRDEDREGRPFVGRAGTLLDKMFAAIDMGRTHDQSARGIYVTNVVPWRPPSLRAPNASEIAMMMPFLERHIQIAAPEVIVLMGNGPCQALLGRGGLTRMRGKWAEALGKPVLPMFHPDYLLRNPASKRDAWADLLDLNARLRSLT